MTAFTNDREGLLASIIANPDDDGLRLIYADWLDENDDPEQAELIRIQIDYDRNKALYQCSRLMYCCGEFLDTLNELIIKGCDRCCRFADYKLRCSSLALFASRSLGFEGIDFTYIRGLPDTIRCPAEWWLKHADKVTKYHPIREVHLTTWPQKNDIEHMLKGGHILATWILDDQSAQDHWNGLTNTLWPNIKFVMPNNQPQEIG